MILPTTPGHRLAALLACLVAPLIPALFDGKSVGYTMYAGVTVYRLDIEATRGKNVLRVAPEAVAAHVGGSAPLFLLGADVPRPARSVVALRLHLDAITQAACSVAQAEGITVTLHEWPQDGAALASTAQRLCP